MKILIGDDHVLFREGLRRLLEQLRENATFAEASNFDELLDMAASKDVAYDLVLTDLRMPGWPGFSGIGMLRERQPNAKVVVVSASEAQADVREALENGAAGYIPKASSHAIMMAALRLVLAGGVYLPPNTLSAHVPSQEPASDGRSGTFDHLTERQIETLRIAMQGKANKVIARELNISEATVKAHLSSVFRALGVKNRTEAVFAAAKIGL